MKFHQAQLVSYCSITVWKFLNFSITHILREIKVCDLRGTENAIKSKVKALNFEFYEIFHFFKTVIDQISKIQSP